MEQVDAVFSSMHFERIYLKKDYYYGTPQKLHNDLNTQLNEIDKELLECAKICKTLDEKMEEIKTGN